MNILLLLEDLETGHSEFQDDHFITIKAGGTTFGQYKQALRELYQRLRALRELHCDREKLLVETRRSKELSNSTDLNEYDRELSLIDTRRKSMQIEESNRTITDTEREFTRFLQQAIALKNKVGELTSEKRKHLEEELWLHRAKVMLAKDMLATGKPGMAFLEMVSSFPDNMKTRAKEFANEPNLADWFLDQSNEPLPKLDTTLHLDVNLLQLMQMLDTPSSSNSPQLSN